MNSFFVFDLTGVSNAITRATLNLWNPAAIPSIPLYTGNRYGSPDASETFNVVDVTTPISTLTAGGSGLTGVFADLGSGTVFGSYAASAADDGTVISIQFNAAGLAVLNAARGSQIAFGGTLAMISGPAEQYLFAYTLGPTGGYFLPDVRRLDLTTSDIPQAPEPASLTLLSLGLVGIAARTRRSMHARLGSQ